MSAVGRKVHPAFEADGITFHESTYRVCDGGSWPVIPHLLQIHRVDGVLVAFFAPKSPNRLLAEISLF